MKNKKSTKEDCSISLMLVGGQSSENTGYKVVTFAYPEVLG